jgi:hypothetical protein
METDIIKTTDNVALSTKAMVLPKYDELSDNRILKEMQKVFQGFDFDEQMQPKEVFKSVAQIEKYAKNVVNDIEAADNDFKLDAVLKAAAISAKRWHFGWVVSKCLKAADYGEDLAPKLAKAAGISVSYLYQYRAVGDRLSMKDAYILGMYGLGWELIRQLAALPDDEYRREIIQNYINSIPDYNNSMIREQARATVKQILDALKNGHQALDDTSNLNLIEAASNFPNEAPEFVEAEKQVQQLKTAIRNLTKDKRVDAFTKAAGDCYLPKEVVGAGEHLESFKESCAEALELIEQLTQLLPNYKQELESLSRLELMENEG